MLVSKAEKFLHPTVADPSMPAKLEWLNKIAVFTNSAAVNLTPSVHEAVEKAVLARLSVRRDMSKALSMKVRSDLLHCDLFHLDVFSPNAVKEAMASQPCCSGWPTRQRSAASTKQGHPACFRSPRNFSFLPTRDSYFYQPSISQGRRNLGQVFCLET